MMAKRPHEELEQQEKNGGSKEDERRRRRDCPYLGTINRAILDFDFERLCSVSLSSQRPYGCLVCGKFFQGRGENTHAMTHALEQHHYLYINLYDTKVYCLPENYEVIDASLDDIKYHLNPTFTPESIERLSTDPIYGKALDGTDYIPGCVGLNNLKKTDYVNVVLQCLCTVIPLRNKLLLLDLSHKQSPDPVLKSLGELFRKIFNPKNFKGLVSPHEFLQTVGVESGKRFRIGEQQDPLAFLAWLLQRLHHKLRDRRAPDDSLINRCFQGSVQVSTTHIVDSDKNESAPTESFACQEISPGTLQRSTIWKLPLYLIVRINRFSKNNFFLEKNPTIVTFPVKNLELKDYVHPDAREENPVTRYDLVGNIVHEGRPHEGHYKCHIYHSPTGEWYEMEDLRVVPVLAQMVALSESYVQIYQRQDIRRPQQVQVVVPRNAVQ